MVNQALRTDPYIQTFTTYTNQLSPASGMTTPYLSNENTSFKETLLPQRVLDLFEQE